MHAPEHLGVEPSLQLVELGYTIADAERALAQTDASASPEERVRQALRESAGGRAA